MLAAQCDGTDSDSDTGETYDLTDLHAPSDHLKGKCMKKVGRMMLKHARATVKALTDRFPNTGVIDAFTVFAPRYWKDPNSLSPNTHGDEHIAVLKAHYTVAKYI
jgi:hypothetical protein